MCDHRHYHQLRHRHCDNGKVLIKGLLAVSIFASFRGKSSSLEAKLFFFFAVHNFKQNKARHVSHLSCLFDLFSE